MPRVAGNHKNVLSEVNADLKRGVGGTKAQLRKGKDAQQRLQKTKSLEENDENQRHFLNDDNKVKNTRRLGEISNAVQPEKQQKLKTQLKKGLNTIVNRSTRSSTSSSSGTVSKLSVVVLKEIKGKKTTFKAKKSTRQDERKKQKQDSSNTSISLEDDIELCGESKSLPSSQEAIAESLKTSSAPDVSSDDSYKSAEEDNTTVVPLLSPQRVVPPEGVFDFDLHNWDDLTQCSEYAHDIFVYYKNREPQFVCPDYLHRQKDISETMRAILVDWLVEIQESFELNHETLYTAVKLMDLYLSKVTVPKESLQLVGAVACLISCKIDERIPPNLDDFVYVCDDAYSRRQIMAKEREMISSVGYDVGYPLSYRFLRRFGRVCRVSMPVLTLARYILETSLMSYKFNVETSESKLGAAALILALKICKVEGWLEPLKFYSGYAPSEVSDLVHSLLEMMKQEPKDCTKTIRQKYSHRVFHEVALISMPATVEL